jgi:hypothetical protein
VRDGYLLSGCSVSSESLDSFSLSLTVTVSVGGVSFTRGEMSRLGTVNSSLTAILFRTWS